MEDPVHTARELVQHRFPDARAVFLPGSVPTEHRAPTSDLDIVVLLAGPPAPSRESLAYRGRPVELFLQTETDGHSFADQETAKRRSPLLAMCADGMLLVDTDGLGVALQDEARERMAAGRGRPRSAPGVVRIRRACPRGGRDGLLGGRTPGAGPGRRSAVGRVRRPVR